MSDTTLEGGCLCGHIRYRANGQPNAVNHCHCEQCRVWSGAPFMVVPCTSATFEGPVGRYQSSDYAERGFCKTCGTHLFFHPLGLERYGVPIGIFDDQSDLPFDGEIYINEKPDFYSFAGERERLTGAEFEAKFR